MKPLVVITNWVHEEVLDLLAPHARLTANRTRAPWPREEVLRWAMDADALMAFMNDIVDRRLLSQCPRLRVVACALKGYDNFDVSACTEAGVWLTVVPDLLTGPTAELAVGLAIALGRRIRLGDNVVRGGAFDGWRPRLYGRGLQGSTTGIVGLGRVGMAIAQRLQGFGARVIGFDQRPEGEPRPGAPLVSRVGMSELLADSDFLFLALPLSPETFHLIGAASLQVMKPSALLINIGRGSVVDEVAVAAALADRRLGGYAADVFECEDLGRIDRPASIPDELLTPEAATVLTPHLGSAVDDVRREIALAAARNILAVLQGETPPDALNHPPRSGRTPRPVADGGSTRAEPVDSN